MKNRWVPALGFRGQQKWYRLGPMPAARAHKRAARGTFAIGAPLSEACAGGLACLNARPLTPTPDMCTVGRDKPAEKGKPLG